MWDIAGKPERKRHLARPRLRWISNTEMNLGVVGLGGENWIYLAENMDKRGAFRNRALNKLENS